MRVGDDLQIYMKIGMKASEIVDIGQSHLLYLVVKRITLKIPKEIMAF